MEVTSDLALKWWRRLADRCVGADGNVRAARGRRRRLPLWPLTQVLHAGILVEPIVPADRRRAHAAQVDTIAAGLDRYRSGDAWGPFGRRRPRYADDVAWVGLALADLGAQRGASFPDDVLRAFAFVRSCEDPDGGIRWHERSASRNACSTAPAAHLALLVHAADGDDGALAFAERQLAWLDETLRRRDGLYADRIEGEVVEPTVWAYSQGEAVLAWRLLADATEDAAHERQAARAADAVGRWLGRRGVLWAQPPAFLGIAARDLSLVPAVAPALGTNLIGYLDRVVRTGLADDGFPTEGGIARYDDDPAIDLAGLVQTAAASALGRWEGRSADAADRGGGGDDRGISSGNRRSR